MRRQRRMSREERGDRNTRHRLNVQGKVEEQSRRATGRKREREGERAGEKAAQKVMGQQKCKETKPGRETERERERKKTKEKEQ